MNKPLVSIIIPTFKRADMLIRSIDSALNQTYKNIEIIVIDDNDPKSEYRKKTERIMERYKNDKRVKYIKGDANRGAVFARNLGIEKAKGYYITFLDDDDEYFPNKIECEVIKMQEGYDMVFSNVEIYNTSTGETRIQNYNQNFTFDRKGLLEKHLVDVISGGIAFIYKKEKLLDIGKFYDIPANQEYILLLNTIVSGMKIGYLNETLCRAYIHNSENRISNSKNIIDAKIEVISIVKPYLKEISLQARRKTLFRLYSFVFYQSFKRRDKRFIKYGFKLLLYVDLLLAKIIFRENNNEYYMNK